MVIYEYIKFKTHYLSEQENTVKRLLVVLTLLGSMSTHALDLCSLDFVNVKSNKFTGSVDLEINANGLDIKSERDLMGRVIVEKVSETQIAIYPKKGLGQLCAFQPLPSGNAPRVRTLLHLSTKDLGLLTRLGPSEDVEDFDIINIKSGEIYKKKEILFKSSKDGKILNNIDDKIMSSAMYISKKISSYNVEISEGLPMLRIEGTFREDPVFQYGEKIAIITEREGCAESIPARCGYRVVQFLSENYEGGSRRNFFQREIKVYGKASAFSDTPFSVVNVYHEED